MKNRIAIAAMLMVVLWYTPSWAGQNILTWTDNSNNEDEFWIERKAEDCAATVLSFAQIVVVGVNVVTYTDAAVVNGSTYCYRVRASNTSGQSAYSNTAGRTVPTIPTPPSGLIITFAKEVG